MAGFEVTIEVKCRFSESPTDRSRTILLQSLGLDTMLNLGANGESPIFQSSKLNPEEVNVFASVILEPVERGSMFINKAFCNPNDSDGSQTCRVVSN